MSDKLAEARRLLEQAQRRLAEVEREARLEIPAEPTGAEVVRFTLHLDQGHPGYRFAAIRVNGRWYTTGRTVQAHGVTWAELIRWIRKHHSGSFMFVHVLSGPDHGASIRVDTP